MIDDHDRCELVNVSFLLGCPGHSPESHKMVVIVVSCLWDLIRLVVSWLKA